MSAFFEKFVKPILDSSEAKEEFDYYENLNNIFFYAEAGKSRKELNAFLEKNNLKYEHVYNEGGSEGDGEKICFSVYKFFNDDGECLVRFDGWYQSYHGSEFKEFFEVNAVERPVTFYERV